MEPKKLQQSSRVHIPNDMRKELGIDLLEYVEVQLVGREFHIFKPETKEDPRRAKGQSHIIDATGRITLGRNYTKQLGWIENETQLVVYKQDNEIIVMEATEDGTSH